MRIPVKARHLPMRIVTGAFILDQGIGKLSADEETAAHLHGMATGTYPFPQQGTVLAKDAWLAAIGLSLVIDDLTDPS